MTITLSMQFQDFDHSDQTNSNAKAGQGEKGKELHITGPIQFTNADVMKRIFELIIAQNSDIKP